MKKNGFTLIELLAVIMILSIILVLALPAVNKVLSQGKETIHHQQINNILDAAYDYSLKNINSLPSYSRKQYITLGELKYEGLVDANIIDTDTQQKFKDNLVISIQNVGSNYKFSNDYTKIKGNYLYTLEIERNNQEELLPTIDITGITKNSKGDYVLTLDLNDTFDNVIVSATSAKGKNLNDKIKKYILLDDIVVDNIDTSKPSIYKINYSVIDEEGYAAASTLSIIIADTIPPTITLPLENTISKEVANFDLIKDVICQDNSNYCDISTSGEIDYGVSGKYVITYTAKDPSGNVATKKRVITIE